LYAAFWQCYGAAAGSRPPSTPTGNFDGHSAAQNGVSMGPLSAPHRSTILSLFSCAPPNDATASPTPPIMPSKPASDPQGLRKTVLYADRDAPSRPQRLHRRSNNDHFYKSSGAVSSGKNLDAYTDVGSTGLTNWKKRGSTQLPRKSLAAVTTVKLRRCRLSRYLRQAPRSAKPNSPPPQRNAAPRAGSWPCEKYSVLSKAGNQFPLDLRGLFANSRTLQNGQNFLPSRTGRLRA